MATGTVVSRRRSPTAADARRVPGEVGTWVFILGDMAVFAFVFATYLVARGEHPALFNVSQSQLDTTIGAVNTLLLLCSSLCVVAAVRAVGRRAVQTARRLFAAAIVFGLGFVLNKYLEYGDKLRHDIKPATNDFWTYYYVLTGLHLFHLIVGLGVLAGLIRLAGNPRLTARRYAYIEGGACFWHMVDLLWIVLFPLLYLVR